jgi:outer membrane murein-binding lipoprotein Lpp
MYRRLGILFLFVAACALLLAGCSKDSQINSTMADIHTTTDEMVKKIDASPTAAGVDEAQKLFDARKPDLKSKWDGIKGARGFQVSEDTKKKMVDSYTQDYTAIKTLEIKHLSVSMQDDAFKSKLEKLVKDWEDTFKVE